MTRKTRYWVCDKCGSVYNRKKKEDIASCWSCGSWMRKARVYPSNLKKKVDRRKARKAREREKLIKRHSVLRTAYKSRLRVSTPTKRAWRHFLAAKQKRTFISRGQKFLEALFHDIWSCPHHKGYQIQFQRSCGCSGGGMVGAPKLKLAFDPNGDLGEFNRGIRNPKGFCIEIYWPHDERYFTFLHEAVHWMDTYNAVNKMQYVGSHSKAFHDRIEDLAKQLGFKR